MHNSARIACAPSKCTLLANRVRVEGFILSPSHIRGVIPPTMKGSTMQRLNDLQVAEQYVRELCIAVGDVTEEGTLENVAESAIAMRGVLSALPKKHLLSLCDTFHVDRISGRFNKSTLACKIVNDIASGVLSSYGLLA